jgi:phytanoyl-CoA hydroxylase
VPVEVPAGAGRHLQRLLLHRSLAKSGRHGYRRALVNHYISAESPLNWKVSAGTGPANCDCRDVVLVAGEDLYACKGTADVTQTYVRPDKEGGCER